MSSTYASARCHRFRSICFRRVAAWFFQLWWIFQTTAAILHSNFSMEGVCSMAGAFESSSAFFAKKNSMVGANKTGSFVPFPRPQLSTITSEMVERAPFVQHCLSFVGESKTWQARHTIAQVYFCYLCALPSTFQQGKLHRACVFE